MAYLGSLSCAARYAARRCIQLAIPTRQNCMHEASKGISGGVSEVYQEAASGDPVTGCKALQAYS